MLKIDMCGKEFGRLTVIKEAESQVASSGKTRIRWNCLCCCGKKIDVLGEKLRSGNTISCGCYHLDRVTKHGFARDSSAHPLYGVWKNIKSRCLNPNFPQYHDYGGRGITICDEWKDDPAAFIKWSLENGWEKGLDCDRKKNNEGYSPKNCQFIPRLENLYNRRPYKRRRLAIRDPF